MFEAILLNPSTRRSRRTKKRKGKASAKRGKSTMRKTKKRKRRAKRRNPVRKARRKRRRRRNTWAGQPIRHRKAAKLGVSRKKRRKRRKNPYGRKRRRRRNPVRIGGRRGKFDLIPTKKTLMDAAYKGGGAVLSEVTRASIYSLIGRASGSVAEDVLGRLASGAITGALVGYLFGAKYASAVVEGTYTVTLYKLVADAVAMATKGSPRIMGVISNPFTAVPTKPLVPGFGLSGLGGVVSEPDVLPLGGVIVPETDVVPIGAMEEDGVPPQFRSRFGYSY